MKHEILRMEKITTYSGGLKLLDHAKLNLFEGEVLGIAGLNCSGKSALVGGINGLFPYAEGVTYYFEKQIRISSVSEANSIGIFSIQSNFGLIPRFSIAENIFLKGNNRKSFFCNARYYRQQSRDILQKMGVGLSPDTPVKYLSYYEKILVEICKAVANKAKIIILDSMLSALSKNKIPFFIRIFQILKDSGISVILIEPKINLIKLFYDRLFVLRKGCTVGELKPEEFNDNKVISLMLGCPIEDGDVKTPLQGASEADIILSFKNVYFNHTLKGLNFDVYRNEITGILNMNKVSGAAIEGLLSGEWQPESGNIWLNDRTVKLKNTRVALKNGIGVVSEEEFLCDEMNLQENILLSAIVKKGRVFGSFGKKEFKYLKNEMISEYISRGKEIVTGEEALPVGWRMRKKVAFCRALASEPEIMVLMNPTQHIDVISKNELYEDIGSLKKRGISVLIISADIEELISICDRMIVVQNGNAIDSLCINAENVTRIIKKYGYYLKED